MSTYNIPNPYSEKGSWKIMLQGAIGLFYTGLGALKLYEGKFFLGGLMAIGGLFFIYNSIRIYKKGPIGFVSIQDDGIKYSLDPLSQEEFIPWDEIQTIYVGKYTMQYLDFDHQSYAIELDFFSPNKLKDLKQELIDTAQKKKKIVSDYPIIIEK